MRTMGWVMAVVLMLASCSIDSVYGQVQGQLMAWGRDTYGETVVPAGDDFVAVAAGERHSVALRADGSIVTWGDLRWNLQTVPAGVFTAVAAGEHYAAALKVDGTLVAWGRDYDGALNVPNGNDFVGVATGCTHGLALKSDGSLSAWGGNTYGQANVPSGDDFVAIACGGYHSLALRADGSLIAWGFDYYGQTDVPGGTDFVAVAGGRAHSLAVKNDGTVVVWGAYLGLDDFWSGIPAWSPQSGDLVTVSGGYSNSLALLTDGTLTSWGRDYYGTMNVPPGEDFIAISAGDFHDLAIAIPESATPVSVDIKPGSWPNPANVKSHGVLPAAVCGTDLLDVMNIDLDTILLTREGIEGGVSPVRWDYQDVATPFDGPPGEGHELGPDGLGDLTLKFETQEVIDVLGLVALRGETIALTLTGSLLDGTAIEGVDWVWILRAGDMDGNGKVDSVDLALWQQNYDPLGKNQDTFAMGDCNGDGSVDSADLALWQQNYDPIGPLTVGAAHVPEPATLALLAIGGLGVVWRKRQFNCVQKHP